LRSRGEHVEGNVHVVTLVGSTPGRVRGTTTVSAKIRTSPGQLINRGGEVERRTSGTSPLDWIFTVTSTASGDVISQATIVSR